MDAGDLLLPWPAQAASGMVPPDPGEVERRARLLLAGLARLGITALGPGETDLLIGPRRLATLVREAKVPVVCANLVDGGGKLLFPADRLVDAAGVRVGIFGILDPPPDEAGRWKSWGIAHTKPAAAARAQVASLRARGAQIVIALLHLHGGSPAARALIAEAPGIDWAVLGHSAQILHTPETEGKTRILEAYQMGKNVGRLDLHVVGRRFDFVDGGQRIQLIGMRDDYRRQIADIKARAASDKTGKLKEFYDRQLQSLQEAIARNDKLIAALPGRVAGSRFVNRIVELDTSVPDHPGLALLVDGYNRESQRRAQQGLPVGVVHTFAPPPGARRGAVGAAVATVIERLQDLTYAGTNACGGCHAPAWEQWQTTKHAHALETLEKKGRAKDPACIGCHVTGFLRPGGTRNVNAAVERFPAVGCESCHGPALAHVTAPDKKTSIKRKVLEAVCRECHTPDQTNNQFEYAAFLKAILGPGHGAPAAPPAKK